MQNLIGHVRQHRFGYIVVLLAFCAQLYLVTRPLSFLLTNILPDDAFYYFEIARNVASHLGSTFDGYNLTNGYHPLWLLVLIGLYAPSQALHLGSELPFRIALVLSVFMNATTSILLYRVLGRYVKSASVSALALAVWALNPFVLYETVNGLETSLSILCLMLFITLVMRFEKSFSSRQLVVIGLVAGLMILARVDLVFYFIAFLLWMFATQGLWLSWKKILVVGLSASVLVVPWLLWNVIGFGMLLTSASKGNAFVNSTLIHQSGVGPLFEIKHIIYSLNGFTADVLQTTGLPLLFLLFLGIALSMFLSATAISLRRLKQMPLEIALVSGFVFLFVADAGIRFTGRSWYFISLNILVAILFAIVLPYITAHAGQYKRLVLLGIAICMFGSFCIGWNKYLDDRMPNQMVMYKATQWGNANLPNGAIIGAFNAGILGYYSTHRVVNLDGLVNNSALKALIQKRTWEYIHSEGITYISDGGYYFTHRYSSFLGITDPLDRMKELADFPVQGGGKADSFSVYEVLR